MGHFKIPADSLDQWASTKSAEDLLPELVRRLIWASVPNAILHINFPSGEKGNRPGYDGTLNIRLGAGSGFVPEGYSVWELGTGEGVEGKLNSDYETRVAEQDAAEANSKTTYLGITPRRFVGRERWEKEKCQLANWGSVRCYDSSSLEQWIESAPAVARWLSTKPPFTDISGASDIDTYWKNICGTLRFPFPPSLFLINQQETITNFDRWINAGPDVLYCRGQCPQEVVDVFTAWVQSLSQDAQKKVTSRTLIVEERETWRVLAGSSQPLILIMSHNLSISPDLIAEAKGNGHHVLIPAYGSSMTQSAVRLERMSPLEVEKQLRTAGYGAESLSLAHQSAGSSYILRRRCSAIPDILRPPWASGIDAHVWARLLLAVAWDDSNDADKRAVSELSTLSYKDTREKINHLSEMADAPVRWSGGIWHFASPLDTWEFLRTSLSPESFQAWEQIAITVLGEDHPGYTLPAEKRHMAEILGKKLTYSSELRQGLATILALLGSREQTSDIKDTYPLSARVNRVVRTVLPSSATWQRWATLGGLLPLLAEADPNAFLEAVEDGLRAEPSPFSQLFDEERAGPVGGRAEHTGLLWALERIAWSEEMLPRVSVALARLAVIDPGGNWTNRPKNSLAGIFFSWMPQTAAKLEARVNVLSQLVQKTPDIAWPLIVGLLPQTHESLFPHQTPDWRPWAEQWDRKTITQQEYHAFLDRIIDIVLGLAGTLPKRWIKLLDYLYVFKPSQFTVALEKLRDLSQEADAETKDAIWLGLEKFIEKHRRFPTAHWSLPADALTQLADVAENYRPQDRIILALPWFKNFIGNRLDPSLPWDEQLKAVDVQRDNAVTAILAEGGFDAVLDLARRAEASWAVGASLAKVADRAHVQTILPEYLNSDQKSLSEFAREYLARLSQVYPVEWVRSLVTADWTPDQISILALWLPFSNDTWQYLETTNINASLSYWRRVRVPTNTLSAEDTAVVIERLIGIGRVSACLELLSAAARRFTDAFTPARILTLLTQILNAEPDENSAQLDPHHLMELVAHLQNSDIEITELAKLEWSLLPLLTGNYYGHPVTLHKLINSDASFFVGLLEMVFKTSKETEEGKSPSLDDAGKRKAENAWKVLNSWNSVPGIQDDGTVDGQFLSDWIATARQKAKEKDRLKVCDTHIGEMLACTPSKEAAWPCNAVCKIMEDLDNKSVERGFFIKVRNMRGVVTKNVNEGGKQERELATKYRLWADLHQSKWIAVTRVLRGLADSYEAEAKGEDQEAGLG